MMSLTLIPSGCFLVLVNRGGAAAAWVDTLTGLPGSESYSKHGAIIGWIKAQTGAGFYLQTAVFPVTPSRSTLIKLHSKM